MTVQRGEIYFVNLDPVLGREQAGQRPVLVLSIDTLNRAPLVVTVVVGTKGANVARDYRTMCVSRQRRAVCRWRQSFFAFNFARSMRRAFPLNPPGG